MTQIKLLRMPLRVDMVIGNGKMKKMKKIFKNTLWLHY